MGNARARGSYSERKASAVAAGRTPENRVKALPRGIRTIARDQKSARDVEWPDAYKPAHIKQHSREHRTAAKRQRQAMREFDQQQAKKARLAKKAEAAA